MSQVGTLRCNVTCDPPQDCHVGSTTIHVMQLANGPSRNGAKDHHQRIADAHKQWQLPALYCVGIHNTQCRMWGK